MGTSNSCLFIYLPMDCITTMFVVTVQVFGTGIRVERFEDFKCWVGGVIAG